jgi:hypothetical protein
MATTLDMPRNTAVSIRPAGSAEDYYTLGIPPK